MGRPRKPGSKRKVAKKPSLNARLRAQQAAGIFPSPLPPKPGVRESASSKIFEEFRRQQGAALGEGTEDTVVPDAPAAGPGIPGAHPPSTEKREIVFDGKILNPPGSAAMLPRSANGLITFYDIMHTEQGFELPPHLVPVCRALMDNRIKNLLITLGPGAGKSILLSVVYPAFEIGQDPTQTVLGISAGENLIQGFMGAVGGWIENHPDWKLLFPFVAPDKDQGWSSERGLFVTGHPPGDPDASYFACGLTSKSLTGKHGRIIIGDDLHDAENSASVDACLKVRERYYQQLIGRANPRGARFIFAGRRWHDEDIYGHLQSTGDWVVMNLPAIREGSLALYWDVTLPKKIINAEGIEEDFKCCFTENDDFDD